MTRIKQKNIELDELYQIDEDINVTPRKQGLWKKVATLLSHLYFFVYPFKTNKKDPIHEYLKEPCLILQNHIYDTDFKISYKVLSKTNFNVASCRDAYLGRKEQMRNLGCVQVLRFNQDPAFVYNALKVIQNLKNRLLIYPESDYPIDGFGLCIPPTFGKMVKFLNVPVLMIRSKGNYHFRPAFTRRKNKSKITANLELLLSKEDVKNKSVEEIQDIINSKFYLYDYYKEAEDLKLKLTNKNRANDYQRVLFKCPHCLKEDCMEGKGNIIRCKECGEEFILNEDYSIKNKRDDKSMPQSIKEWVLWQRKCINEEVVNKTFKSEFDAKIYAFRNHDCLYNLNNIVKVKYENDKLYINNDKINLVRDLSSCWGLCVVPLRDSVGPVIIIDVDDTNYFLSPVLDNGEIARLKFAVAESYRIKNNK